MMKNFLNAPVITIAAIGMISSSSLSIPNNEYYSSSNCIQYKYTINDCMTSNFSRDVNMKVQKVTLEESTNIGNSVNGFYNTENSKYIIKNNLESFINSMENVFGEMRYLTDEGQIDYNKNLDELYSDIGVQLFDFI